MLSPGGSHAVIIAIKPLEQAAMRRLGIKIRISLRPKELLQLKLAEEELIESIKDLKAWNRIFDTLPTLNEVMDPPEKVKMAVARGGVFEIDLNEEDSPDLCITRVQALCEQLAGVMSEYGEADDIFELSKQLCHFRGHSR